MAILNYTTGITFEKTISEITSILVAHGANKIVSDYSGNIPTAITFCLTLNGNMIAFALPANYSGVLKAMKNDKKVPNSKCTEEQALRVSWRIVKDWIEAQMAFVDAQLADMAEVFLPYAITPSGNTLYKEIQNGGMKMLQSAR